PGAAKAPSRVSASITFTSSARTRPRGAPRRASSARTSAVRVPSPAAGAAASSPRGTRRWYNSAHSRKEDGMASRLESPLAAATLLAILAAAGSADEIKWPIHDRDRPAPRVVTPGTFSTAQEPGKPPSDAIVLFDGKDLSKWRSDKANGPAGWKVENGYFEVA